MKSYNIPESKNNYIIQILPLAVIMGVENLHKLLVGSGADKFIVSIFKNASFIVSTILIYFSIILFAIVPVRGYTLTPTDYVLPPCPFL
jgi:hypothetical protein